MGCNPGVEAFRPGTTLKLPFLVTADETIVDLTGGAVTAVVEPMGAAEIVLAEGSGIEIETPNPPPAAAGADQLPHGYLTLTPEQTETLPLGQLTELTLLFLTAEGVQTYSPSIWLRGE